ncbi:MAG: tetratricopeptide repeat protein [Elusimicrobiota bacterium]|nr:MAG: tetratricopeptide repeat protein [Elusimicrobiota bacterium]
MTARAPEEVRLKPVRGRWAWGGDWLSAQNVTVAAAVAMTALFGMLYFALREKPMPRRRADFPAPPQVATQIAAAQERLKADPEDIAALVELGTLKFEKGKEAYVEAIGDLEEARDLGALDPRVFYCLGIMYQETGLYPFALTEYKRFLRHYPEDKEVRMLTAKLYYRMGLFPEAVGQYERLKFSDPSDPLIEENLGLSLWGAKSIDRASASFAQLKAVGGDFARRAEFYLGQIALEAGKFQEAYDHFVAVGTEVLPGLEPQRAPTGLAMAAQKLGKWEEARVAWETALRAAPGDAKATAALKEATRRAAALKKTADAAAEKARRDAERAAKAAAAKK